MDINETLELFHLVEEAGRHGASFTNIRNAAIARLNEIDAEMAPPPPEPKPEPKYEETDDVA